MNYDITWCANHKCPKRGTCRRNTDFIVNPPHELSYAVFEVNPKTGKCDSYWPLDTIELDIQTTNQEKGK